MRTVRISLTNWKAAIAVLVLLGGAASLRAQDSTRINVGFASAKPTDQIDIPITFSGAEGTQAGTLAAKISYPKTVLSFTSVERALAAELADAEVKATAGDHGSDKNLGVVDLTITGKTPIKPGIVAYVKFNAAKDAQKGELELALLESTAKAADGGPVQLAKGDGGSVTMFGADEEIPVVGCFFFTH